MAKRVFIIACGGFYLISLITKFQHLPVPVWFSSYAADLLCMPLMLFSTQLVIRLLPKFRSFLFTPLMLVLCCIYVSVSFEWILPSLKNRYIADLFDVAAYAAGTLAYYFIQPTLFNNSRSNHGRATASGQNI